MLLKTLTLEPKHAGRQPIAFSKSPASYCKFSKVFLYGSRIDWNKTTWKETETCRKAKFYRLTGLAERGLKGNINLVVKTT